MMVKAVPRKRRTRPSLACDAHYNLPALGRERYPAEVRGQQVCGHAAAAAGGLTLALAGLYAGNNPDTFGHLAQGREIVALGRVPLLDSFSLITPPQPFVNYEWLSDLLYYLLYARFGYDGLLGLKCLVLFGMGMALVALGGKLAVQAQVGSSPSQAWTAGRVATLLIVLSAVPAARMRLSDRPHVLGMALASLVALLLVSLAEATSRRRRALHALGLFVLHVLWLNLHGSHLLGMGMTFAFLILGQRAARPSYAAVLGLQGLACFLSPYGPRIVLDALVHVFDPQYRAYISEWRAWRDRDVPWLQLGPALQAAVLTLFLPRLLRSGQSARALLFVAAVLGVGAFRSVRFIAEFLLLTAPLLGAALAARFQLSADTPTSSQPARLWAYATHPVRLAWAALTGLLLVVPWAAAELPPDLGFGHGAFYVDRPLGSATWLRQKLRAPRVFSTMDDGWFLMFGVPGAHFAIDGRSTFYGPAYIASIIDALEHPPALLRRLKRDQIDSVVARYTKADEHGVARTLEAHPAFARVLIENDHVLYVRRDRLPADTLPLQSLRAQYDAEALGTADDAQITREIEALARFPNTDAYVSYTRALLLLRPFARGGATGGFRWPRTPDERTRYRDAAALLERAMASAPEVPSVSALAAVVWAVACEPARAQHALARVDAEQSSRETILAAQELALRPPHRDVASVARFLAEAEQDPRSKGDPWLQELRGGLQVAPDCGP